MHLQKCLTFGVHIKQTGIYFYKQKQRVARLSVFVFLEELFFALYNPEFHMEICSAKMQLYIVYTLLTILLLCNIIKNFLRNSVFLLLKIFWANFFSFNSVICIYQNKYAQCCNKDIVCRYKINTIAVNQIYVTYYTCNTKNVVQRHWHAETRQLPLLRILFWKLYTF